MSPNRAVLPFRSPAPTVTFCKNPQRPENTPSGRFTTREICSLLKEHKDLYRGKRSLTQLLKREQAAQNDLYQHFASSGNVLVIDADKVVWFTTALVI